MTEEEFTKQFTKLFAHMDKRFDAIENELAKKADADTMDQRFDQIMAALENLEVEQAAVNAQLDRHERWHHEVADHLGLKLQHDG
ncbi:hypothetical protein [Nocardia fluminea]|uniref:hypothetical protein n=1 Tax=Nocardia fluminea TaxID=134984 RepID=UPI00365B989D